MLPEAFLNRMETQLGAEFPEYLQSLERPRAVALRFNPLKGEKPELPFVGENVPWGKRAIIMRWMPVPVCTLFTKPAYIIYRKPALCRRWRY